MKITLFQEAGLAQDYADIHYQQMTAHLQRALALLEDGTCRLQGKHGDETAWIPIEQVYYFDSVDKRTFAYLADRVYQVDMTLAEIETAFRRQGFARINKSNVVNIHRIDKIRPLLNMRVCAVLDNGESLVVNRSYKSHFETVLREL